jgi:hypothetical protein
MSLLVVTAHAEARAVRLYLLDHYSDIAGGLIVTVGAAALLMRI